MSQEPKLLPLLSLDLLLEAVETAHTKLEEFRSMYKDDASGYALLGYKGMRSRSMWAHMFAEDIVGVPVLTWSKLPKPGHGSWVMRVPTTWIAVSVEQLSAWSELSGLSVEAQRARAVYHEVGHLTLGHVAEEDSEVTDEDERAAWAFAMGLLGILAADCSQDPEMWQGDSGPAVVV